MSVSNFTGLIVYVIAPILIASRRLTARGKVGWFFLTIIADLFAMGIGMVIPMVVARLRNRGPGRQFMELREEISTENA
jgi:hypothetical protein